MRCPASPARVLTLLSLAILLTQLTLVNAQSTGTESDTVTSDTGTPTATTTSVSTPPTSSTSESATTSETPVTTSSPTSSDVQPTSTSSSQDETSSPTASSPPSTTSSASPTSESSSSSAVTSTSLSTSTSSTSTRSSIKTSSSATPTSTSISQAQPLLGTDSDTATSSYKSVVTEGITETGPSSTVSVAGAVSTGSGASSSNSFFSNKSAVAGVFSVVGIVGLLILIAIVQKIVRSRRRRHDEEDTYINQDFKPQNDYTDSPPASELGHGALQTANDGMYPDRSTHYGLSAYDDTQPRDSIVEYAKGTAIAAARHQDGPYQYGGQAGAYGSNFTNTHYQAQFAGVPGNYASADPYSIARQGTAAPMNNGYGYAQ